MPLAATGRNRPDRSADPKGMLINSQRGRRRLVFGDTAMKRTS